MGAMVISGKRRSFAEYERSQNVAAIAALKSTVSNISKANSAVTNLEFNVAGEVEDYTPEKLDPIIAKLAAEAGVPKEWVEIKVEGGSVVLKVSIRVPDAQSGPSAVTADSV